MARPHRARLGFTKLEDRWTPATFVVTTPLDNGDNADPLSGSLREAILNANLTAEADNITFAIPTEPASPQVQVLTLAADLPVLLHPVHLQGYSQTGAQPNTRSVGSDAKIMIEIEASGHRALASNFQSDISGTIVEGLAIVNSDRPGIDFRVAAGSNIIIRGNHIGVRADGQTIRGNNGGGIDLGGIAGHVVGGEQPADRNVISGNDANGLTITTLNNVRVQNNYIGIDATGQVAAGNSMSGIVLEGGNHTIRNNVISGNTGNGIFSGVNGSSPPNMLIQGNKIGTNAEGSKAIGNQVHGLNMRGTGHLIGGTKTSERNTISGNANYGVHFTQSNITLHGNHIGTNTQGTKAIPNGWAGVSVAANVVIGGTAPGQGNLISGNSGQGIVTNGKVLIQGNRIGTQANGLTPLPNQLSGISINHPGDAVIGGDSPEAANIIAFNGENGIRIELNSNPKNNAFLRNSIHSNELLGIHFVGTGGNRGQSAPELTAALITTSGAKVSGILESVSSTYLIQFYASPAADPSGFGEGKQFIGETTITTNAAGEGSFTTNLAADLTGLPSISAIATNIATNDSSPFSNAITLTNPQPTRIQGVVFQDTNGNGQRDSGESIRPGVVVYLDTNANAIRDTNEPALITDARGEYAFIVPDGGTYRVTMVNPSGFTPTTLNPVLATVATNTTETVIFGLKALPTVPPTTPPTVPPSVPPTTPPTVPPTTPPTVPPPPTSSRRTRVGYPEYALGADAGASDVTLYNPDSTERRRLTPFGSFTGGTRTAAADFNNDGIADVVAGTGPGRANRVDVFDGVTGATLFSIDPFEAAFTGGVYVAAGDITGDGIADLIITPDEGGGPVSASLTVATSTSSSISSALMIRISGVEPGQRLGILMATVSVTSSSLLASRAGRAWQASKDNLLPLATQSSSLGISSPLNRHYAMVSSWLLAIWMEMATRN